MIYYDSTNTASIIFIDVISITYDVNRDISTTTN